MSVDTMIIGAGVAGLAAARTLVDARVDCVVLEARERIGGRIHTVRDPRCPMPIELGAEFLHGPAKETMAIVRAARLRAIDVGGEHWRARTGRWHQISGFWHELALLLRRIDRREPDESFRDFLDHKPGGRSLARARKLALEFVEGFHASDASLISTHALAEAGIPGDDPEQQRVGRIVDGYDAVPHFLANGLGDRIHLGAAVERVTWKRGQVTAHVADGRTLTARTALVTVPLGVLQARTLQVDPPVPTLEHALDRLAMGAVLRVALLFDRAIWEERTEQLTGSRPLHNLSFVHASELPVPVWWTAYPARAPLLVGWSGGPKARLLSDHSPEALEAAIVGSAADLFALTRAGVRKRLQAIWTHDWQRDPYARGAYSYPMVGGLGAGKLLARPASQTLFFAGEATDPAGRHGTVDGALATGMRAARQIIQAIT